MGSAGSFKQNVARNEFFAPLQPFLQTCFRIFLNLTRLQLIK
ncbi:MAG: hypothetical protein ACD_10C00493G0005 [uncultured bacterium]|nr:MAG: hypothetical protein ACD_10C00493G0005 [uncultured bacterium]